MRATATLAVVVSGIKASSYPLLINKSVHRSHTPPTPLHHAYASPNERTSVPLLWTSQRALPDNQAYGEDGLGERVLICCSPGVSSSLLGSDIGPSLLLHTDQDYTNSQNSSLTISSINSISMWSSMFMISA